MKIWISPYTKVGISRENEGTEFLETTDPRLLEEKLLELVKKIGRYHKVRIEILNND
jgi:hypothetical protein